MRGTLPHGTVHARAGARTLRWPVRHRSSVLLPQPARGRRGQRGRRRPAVPPGRCGSACARSAPFAPTRPTRCPGIAVQSTSTRRSRSPACWQPAQLSALRCSHAVPRSGPPRRAARGCRRRARLHGDALKQERGPRRLPARHVQLLGRHRDLRRPAAAAPPAPPAAQPEACLRDVLPARAQCGRACAGPPPMAAAARAGSLRGRRPVLAAVRLDAPGQRAGQKHDSWCLTDTAQLAERAAR